MRLTDLVGRHAEREAAGQLLVQVKNGRSGVLVVYGDAGIGKTALLEATRVTADSSGFRVRHVTGVESEAEFVFASLHQLCAPLMNHAGALPEPQQTALNVAFGLRSGAAPDRFLVGLAILNLLAEAAEEQPLLCLIDDAQWLDQASAQVLAFVARRVAAEQVALVFALRDPPGGDDRTLAGLPELRLKGLSETDARALLSTATHTPLDDDVRDRIVAEACGSPLALLELPRSAQSERWAGEFESPGALSVPRRIEDSFQRRSSALPDRTRLLMLIAAADPTGDMALLWRAAEHLGIPREAAAPAESAGLLEIGSRVRFCHPLARSAVYRTATPPDQRGAHSALAAATDPEIAPDRRAWHRARSVLGTDEAAAADLERSADRALGRGGCAAAAAFLRRATLLSPEPVHRARRALQGARAQFEAGAFSAALELLEVAAAGPLDALQHARMELLRAQIAFHLTQGSEVPGMLLDAAKALAPLNAVLARETYLQALDTAIISGGVGFAPEVREVAEAASSAPPSAVPGPVDLLLDGLAMTYTQGYEAGAPGLKRALGAFHSHESRVVSAEGDDTGPWLWLATRTAAALFDEGALLVLSERNLRIARESCALASLPSALVASSWRLVFAGELDRAAELADEAEEITRASGAVPLRDTQLTLDAWRGRAPEAVISWAADVTEAAELADSARGAEITLAMYALAVLHNGLGDYPAARQAATRVCDSYELSNSLALVELVEASSRAGDPECAGRALAELSSRARASGTALALGLVARSRALAANGPDAEEHYREAIERLRDGQAVGYLARTHLVYGEWLRRAGRRRSAREELRTAHELLSEMGAEAFAARAAHELGATGEHPRKRTTHSTDALTTHELRIARLVTTGATSREVAAQLFLSPRTIEAHLRNIYRKLGITSRRQLRELNLS